MNTVRVIHSAVYKYPRPVMLGPQTFRLCPRKDARALIKEYSLKIRPVDDVNNVIEQQDDEDNSTVTCTFPELVESLEVDVEFLVELKRAIRNPPKHWFPARLNRSIHREIRYNVRMTPGVQTPDETLSKGTGSCRDLAWLLFSDLQKCGVTARYVSGYLIQEDVEAADLHAWVEVLYDQKWVGLDPTLGIYAGAGHLPLAVGPHFSCTAPISGVVEATEVEFTYEVSVSHDKST
jgi:Transglutaminase-like superfamily/Bacterial transglutaminase-like N-terminal region